MHAEDLELDTFANRDREPRSNGVRVIDAPPARPPWWTGPELVAKIDERADDPFVDLHVGADVITTVRVGGIIALIGGSGSGKTSLTAAMLVHHARHTGPAIALSIELPVEELAARMVGQQCDASWADALTGKVMRSEMVRVLDLPRLLVLDRRRATLANLELAVQHARRTWPGQPVIAAFDYAQILPLDTQEREARQRVAAILRAIDESAREHKYLAIALSQMSRVSAQRARSGEAIGAESTDLGAESAAIEQYASVTLSIGRAAKREDGSSAVELSVGKGRMTGGDLVWLMNYEGRTGRWTVANDPKPASDVRETRVTEGREKAASTIKAALLGIASRHPEPLSRATLKSMVTGNAGAKQRGLVELLSERQLVEVMRKVGKGSKKEDSPWKVWTPTNATKAGIEVVPTVEPQGALPV